MKKAYKALTAVIMIVILVTFFALPTYAAESDGRREIRNTFTFGRYAPEIEIRNAALPDRSLTATTSGKLTWSKAVPGKWEQSWLILPASKAGYYVIREFTSEHAQRVITYTPQGFVLEYPSRQTGPTAAQMFRFKWYATRKAGGRTFKDVWAIPCSANSVCLCAGGWATFELTQMNWSNNY